MENTKIDWKRINNDVNGNPRYVCHYLNLLTEGEKEYQGFKTIEPSTVSLQYEIALKRAKKLGGRKFHNKQYGGGIVFQSYNLQDTERQIIESLK